jgi:hypothetical protein
VAYLNDGVTAIPDVGDTGWGTTLNAAINAIDDRFNYNATAANFQLAGEAFFYLGADGSGITTSATNPYGVSPTLTLNNLYEFEYFLRLTNSATGAVTLGWAGTATTQFQAQVLVSLENVVGSSTSMTGVNHFNSTTNKAITGAATAAIHGIYIKGVVLKGTATAAFPLQVSVASGTITPKAGSWFRYRGLGLSTGGTTSITHGTVA